MSPGATDPRPFAGEPRALLALAALPPDHPEHASLAGFATLILRELPEMEAEAGCPVAPVAHERLAPGEPAILIGPAAGNAPLRAWREARCDLPDVPFVAIDRDARLVVVDATTVSGIGDAMQLLRTAIAERRALVTPSVCESAAEVLDRLDTEARRTFPLLGERAPGWAAAVDAARQGMRDPEDLAALQRLMATLGDAHSWAKDPRVNGRLPYHLHDDGAIARFWSVPEGSATWAEGVRPGDRCIAPDTAPWRERTGSAPVAKPWNIGYRALQGRVGEVVELAAIRRDGSVARWSETIQPLPWNEPIDTGSLDPRTGYLRVRGWLATPAWRDALTAALDEMTPYERLVVDLRGNVGGSLIAAQDARARFLPRRTALGTIRFSTVTGEMDRPHELVGEPPAEGPRWVKPVRFLTDPLCYSATEDFLQGLQGLPHVQLVGQATGGGSGRPRTIRLREQLIATISTALTYDRAGRCIEGTGLAPDVPILPDPLDPEVTLRLATAGW
jgi:carboxyl-terminal processing protease